MINNWIDRFPPPLSANRAVLKRSFIEDRARRCARVRGHKANLIASDFYDQGKLVDAVRELNGVSGNRRRLADCEGEWSVNKGEWSTRVNTPYGGLYGTRLLTDTRDCGAGARLPYGPQHN
jgi:hypothetical protein